MFTCKTSKRTVIGYLDENTRIVAAERFFVIHRKSAKTGKWVGMHYYSHFTDLLRAYARMLVNEGGDQNQSVLILQLLDRVVAWEQKMEAVGTKLQEEWQKVIAVKSQSEKKECVPNE